MTLAEAQAELEAAGLIIGKSYLALMIAASVEDSGGIKISHNASVLSANRMFQPPDGTWLAIFPAEGMLSYEITGTPEFLLSVIKDVYKTYAEKGGPFKDAFKNTMPNSESYLVGKFGRGD